MVVEDKVDVEIVPGGMTTEETDVDPVVPVTPGERRVSPGGMTKKGNQG